METNQLFILTYLLTHSMQHSPSWEANRFSASQEIPRILYNPKVNYLSHKCPPPVTILRQINPIHATQPISWRSILIWPPIYAKVFQMVYLPQVSPPKPCIYTSPPPYTCYMPRPSHCSRFYYPNTIWSPFHTGFYSGILNEWYITEDMALAKVTGYSILWNSRKCHVSLNTRRFVSSEIAARKCRRRVTQYCLTWVFLHFVHVVKF